MANRTTAGLSRRLLSTDLGEDFDDFEAFFMLVGSLLVLFMQAGFALYEVGSARVRYSRNILLKNVMDTCLSGLVWYTCGYAFAYGRGGSAANPFIGMSKFFFITDEEVDNLMYMHWTFSYAFAATASTIMSGAVMERCQQRAYMVSTVILTSFIYPVVVHWIWSTDGWASCFNDDAHIGSACGIIDGAGSGVIHMVGGCAALMGAWVLGPRIGRFTKDGTVIEFPGQSTTLATLGVFFLWIGWYAFNAFSISKVHNAGSSMGLSAVNTTLASSSAAVASVLIHNSLGYRIHIGHALNGILSGAVGITAGCFFLEPYAAVIVGVMSGAIYVGASVALKRLRIDDPVDATPVHLGCGMWGMLSPGLFARKHHIIHYYGLSARESFGKYSDEGIFYGGDGNLFGAQIIGILVICAWAMPLCLGYLLLLRKIGWLRVPLDQEVDGLNLTNIGANVHVDAGGAVHGSGAAHLERTNDVDYAAHPPHHPAYHHANNRAPQMRPSAPPARSPMPPPQAHLRAPGGASGSPRGTVAKQRSMSGGNASKDANSGSLRGDSRLNGNQGRGHLQDGGHLPGRHRDGQGHPEGLQNEQKNPLAAPRGPRMSEQPHQKERPPSNRGLLPSIADQLVTDQALLNRAAKRP